MRAPFVPTRTLAGCITPAAEQQRGDEEAKKVEEEMGLLREPALAGYVQAVGEKLAAVSERPEGPWQFEVVSTSPSPTRSRCRAATSTSRAGCSAC